MSKICCHDSRNHDLENKRCGICHKPLFPEVYYEEVEGPTRMLGNLMLFAIFLMAVVILVVCGVRPAQGQTIPTTQPVDDVLYFRSMESGGTVVLIQQRQNHEFSYTTDQWYRAVWYDTFIWRPGHNWAPFYGWEARHLTVDGRWVVLHKPGQLPRTVAVLKTLENYRTVVWWRCDFDHDGDIDQADFGVIQAQLGRVGPLDGDLDNDGMVDQSDVDLWWRLKLDMSR